jgi:hypothetical protein
MGNGYLRTNPLEGVQGTGKRRYGKPQRRTVGLLSAIPSLA